MKFGSLFSGAGGMDLGFEQAGLICAFQSETDKLCIKLLKEKWPDVPKYRDVRHYTGWPIAEVDLLCGGDPCPAHSRARGSRASNHPDLSGYFLAVAARFRPRWVVRENVPAPGSIHFSAGLAAIGYGSVIVTMDAAQVTGQSRTREFVVGCYQTRRNGIYKAFLEFESSQGDSKTLAEAGPIFGCLTTHRGRYDSRDGYIFEQRGLRVPDGDERDALSGLPEGWTARFSETARARMTGNVVVPAMAKHIGKFVLAFDGKTM